MRLFVAVDIPKNELIRSFLDKIRGCNPDLKVVTPENLHLTLKFLGETDKDPAEVGQAIEKASKGVESFKMALEGCGVFPNRNYIRVVWIGVKDAGNLKELADELDRELEALGFKRESRSFLPHLTVARVKSKRGKEEIMRVLDEFNGVKFCEFEVSELKLYQSTLLPGGPVYTQLREVRLG